MTPTRVTGTTYESIPLGHGDRALSVCEITQDGRTVGLIEYVALACRGVTRYGWRPLHSGWTGSQLKTKAGACRSLGPSL